MDIDTNSYPKPALPVSALETAGQIGGLLQRQRSLQQADIGIDQSKLDLYNKHFQIMNNELSTLANDPNTTKEEALTRMHRIGDMFNMPKEVRAQMEAEFAPAPSGIPLGKDGAGNPTLARILDFTIKRGMDIQQKLNANYGASGTAQDNANIYTTRQPLRGPPQAQAVMPIQPPPTQGTIDTRQTLGNDKDGNPIPNPNFNQPTILGPSGPSGLQPLPVQPAAGGVATSAGTPAAPVNALPVNVPRAIVTPPKNSVLATPAVAKDQGQAPQGNPASPIVTGSSPAYEKGFKFYTDDQDQATSRASALKPALNALDLIKEVRTGPSTGTFNKVMAFLKTNGIVPTKAINDPTAAYQELNKYLQEQKWKKVVDFFLQPFSTKYLFFRNSFYLR